MSIIGAGRLGRSLARLLPEARLVRRGEDVPEADVYWLAVRDADIGAVVVPAGGVVLHSSGALGPEVITREGDRGVLHPLMTFPGPEIALPALPVHARVEGTPRAISVATDLARALGWIPFTFAGDRRRYHAAAVMVSGLAGALFCQAAEELAAASGMEPAEARTLLYPLAAESLRRAAEYGPSALTGPAARGDVATMAGHMEALGAGGRAAYAALSTLAKGLSDGAPGLPGAALPRNSESPG